MMRSLWSAASGMIAQQTNMDIVAHNLANVDTYGNKTVRAEFQDLLYQTLRDSGGNSSASTTYPQGKQVGLGVRVAATHRVFTQGPLQTTEKSTDVGIQGDGFFQIQLPSGDLAYTRDGSFKIDSEGNLLTTDGYTVNGPITFPTGISHDSIVIAQDGTVSYTDESGATNQVGTIQIYRFINPEGLTSIGKNLFRENAASGTAVQVDLNATGESNSLAQGTIEMSGVQVVEEMVNMIIAQRAYESNSKAITTSDSMLEIANGLKR